MLAFSPAAPFFARGQPPRQHAVVTRPYKTLPGVPSRLLSLDIYPAGGARNAPVLIWVHGGGWQNGDKRNQLSGKRRFCEARGYLLVSVNYRLSPDPGRPADPARIRYPDQEEDVADAVAWVFTHIAAYGGDPGRIVLMGHSAGGHLVSLLATADFLLPARGIATNRLKGIISLDAGGYDLVSQSRLPLLKKLYENAFGSNPDTLRKASPLFQIRPPGKYPPFLVVTRGSPARMSDARRFASRLRATGAEAEIVPANPYSHGRVNTALGDPADTLVTPAVEAFLDRCVGRSQASE